MTAKRNTHAGAGLLVMGMHRSGTSAVSGMLGMAGADLGARVLGASEGNETGHWEDGFAVSLHEQLLSQFGSSWSEPFGLPADWADGLVASAGRDSISRYLRDDRAAQAPWVVKDPRLCLFAPLWLDAANREGIAMGAVVVLRDPTEVVASLYRRDGLGPRHAELLWLDHVQAALQAASKMPHVVVGYDALMHDWRGVARRLAGLPGADALQFDARAAEVDAFLDPAQRHHRASREEDGGFLGPAWHLLKPIMDSGVVHAGVVEALKEQAFRLRAVVRPLLQEAKQRERDLWLRTARAEARLADGGAEAVIGLQLSEMREFLKSRHEDVVAMYSHDIRRMQETTASALARADALQALEQARREEGATLVAELDDQRSANALLEARLEAQRSENAALQSLAETHRSERIALASQLDASKRELSAQAAEIRALRPQAELLERIRVSHSWRLTKPLRVLRRLLTGKWSASDSAQGWALLRRAAQEAPLLPSGLRKGLVGAALPGTPATPAALPDAHAAALLTLAPRRQALADVFVWSVIDWHFRTQRPQHLARALARKGHRVFYMSNNFCDSSEPGFRVEPLDAEGRLFQVHLNLQGAPGIYFAMPTATQADALRASFASLLAWTCTDASISLAQHPYWTPLLRAAPNARLVYDCMDHHAGFDDNANAILDAERELLEDADLVVVTSGWLQDEVRPHARATALVRNAGEYAFFCDAPAEVFRDPHGRQVIGYYGAIADWFDAGLVRRVATAYPDALVVLVGSDTGGVGVTLSDLPNVRTVGEVAYATLPYWLHGFDVCLLPFKVVPLTMATNPVKVYEYLAAGKPVVAVDLPEMAQFDGLVRTAKDADAFVAAVGDVLTERDVATDRRRLFASGQTWAHRAEALDAAIAAIAEPRVSVVVLTYNNLAFTQACLSSIEAHSDYSNLEVIVVDNASTDASPAWLRAWASEVSPAGHSRRLILNDRNAGFSAGNNLGLKAATGEYLVVLNNDTYVTPGWVRTLCAHFRRDPGLGLVGPVTNNIGNEARIEIAYADMDEMIARAGAYTRAHPGALVPMRTAAFFCAAMPRGVYSQVGGMDEDFGIGFFEDDDYCRRVERAGFRIGCAEDVFVHHHLSASFDKLKAAAKQELFEKNKAIYESKWGTWEPHRYRQMNDRAAG